MAVRNIENINKAKNNDRIEKQNMAKIRMAHINSLMNIIRESNDNIIDAIDTYSACSGLTGSDKLSEYKGDDIYITSTKGKRCICIHTYTDGGRHSNTHHLEYYPDTMTFNGWTCYGWGGFDSWDWNTGKYNDEVFVRLLEGMTSKVEPWCQNIFNFAANV